MKQNAPWEDRTPAERAAAGQGNLKGARHHLNVTVNRHKAEDVKMAAARHRMADLRDAENLAYHNKMREAEGKVPWSRLPLAKREPRDFALKKKSIVTIRASHGARNQVPYAIWLELGNNGRYSIIGPTIDYWGPKFFRSIQILINRGLVEDTPQLRNPNQAIEDIADPKSRPNTTTSRRGRRSRRRGAARRLDALGPGY